MSVRLKETADLVTSCVASGPRPFVALEHLESGTGRLAADVELPERPAPETGAASVEPGDVLFGKLRPYLAKTWLADRPVFVSTELLSLRPRAGVDSRWLAYLVASDPVLEWAVATSDGTKMPRTSWEKLAEYRVDIPPIDDQRAIANYLDRDTARIDALIEKKRRMAQLFDLAIVAGLEEELTQVASRLPLRRLLLKPPQYGASESGEQAMEDWPRYIRITDLESDGALRSDDPRYLDPSAAAAYTLEDRDILIARSGATVGKVSMYREAMGPCAFAGYLIRFSFDPRKMLPELFAMWTRTADYWDQIRQNLVQATIENVSAEKYKDLLVPVPSVAKQEQLVRVVGRRRQRADRVGAGLSQQIALLQEHRQALITAAVTGKLEIPEVAA